MGTITQFPIGTKALSEAPEVLALGTNISNHAGDNAMHVNSTWKTMNEARLANIERALAGVTFDLEEQSGEGYSVGYANPKTVQTRVKKIGGKTVAFNQMVEDGNFPSITKWTTDQNTSIFASANRMTVTHIGTSTSSNCHHRSFYQGPSGHKYFVSIYLNSVSSGNTAYLALYAPGWISCGFSMQHLSLGRNDFIFTATNIVNVFAFGGYSASQSGTAVFSNAQFFDLTAIFGAGNEPAEAGEFRAMFPGDYYAYTTGSLVSADVSAVESVGFNLWDEEWESGGYGSNGEAIACATTIRSKQGNYIKVLPYTTYYLESPRKVYVCQYDNNKAFIRYVDTSGIYDTTFTTSVSCAYLRFQVGSTYGTTYNNDICINRSQPNTAISPHNGEYRAYMHYDVTIPQSLRTAHPLRSAGAVHDEYDLERMKFVQRVGSVDLGSLTWSTMNSNRFSANFNLYKKVANAEKPNFICPKYTTIDRNQSATQGCITAYSTTESTSYGIIVCDSTYTDAAAFKTAMSGVVLNYELATPVETDISAYFVGQPILKAEGAGHLDFTQIPQTLPVPYALENLICLNA